MIGHNNITRTRRSTRRSTRHSTRRSTRRSTQGTKRHASYYEYYDYECPPTTPRVLRRRVDTATITSHQSYAPRMRLSSSRYCTLDEYIDGLGNTVCGGNHSPGKQSYCSLDAYLEGMSNKRSPEDTPVFNRPQDVPPYMPQRDVPRDTLLQDMPPYMHQNMLPQRDLLWYMPPQNIPPYMHTCMPPQDVPRDIPRQHSLPPLDVNALSKGDDDSDISALVSWILFDY